MRTTTITKNKTIIAIIESNEILIKDAGTALDLMMTIKYETDCELIAINKEAISEEFFQLSTGIAGEILQKFVNYHIQFAIIGDFSHYKSKALSDFIYECNHGNHIFFVPTLDDIPT